MIRTKHFFVALLGTGVTALAVSAMFHSSKPSSTPEAARFAEPSSSIIVLRNAVVERSNRDAFIGAVRSALLREPPRKTEPAPIASPELSVFESEANLGDAIVEVPILERTDVMETASTAPEFESIN